MGTKTAVVAGVVSEALALLGTCMRDKVTGYSGMVGTVGFDAYGCVQIVLIPTELDKDGKRRDGEWFDMKRLEPDSGGMVIMQCPFIKKVDTGCEPGPERKPAGMTK